MKAFYKWEELLSNPKKLDEWVTHYQKNDPIFNVVIDFCKQNKIDDSSMLKLSIIAILDEKVNNLSEKDKVAYYVNRPVQSMRRPARKFCYTEDESDKL